MLVVIAMALIACFIFEGTELYRANLDSWTLIGRWILGS